MKKILPLMAMLLMVAIILPSCSDDVEEPVVTPEEEEEAGYALPMLVDGRKWVHKLYPCGPYPDPNPYKYTVYEIDGDTVYKDKKYKKLMYYHIDVESGEVVVYSAKTVNSLMREENGRIYRVTGPLGKQNDETLFFDCNVKDGDSYIQPLYTDGPDATYTWSVKDTVTSEARRIYSLYYEFEDIDYRLVNDKVVVDTLLCRGRETYFIEGVGHGAGFYYDDLSVGGIREFICCHDADGTCLYSSKPDHDCPLKASQK